MAEDGQGEPGEHRDLYTEVQREAAADTDTVTMVATTMVATKSLP